MKYRSWLEIDSSNIIHNLKEAQGLVNNKVKLMVVVKSNAYGHGTIEMSKLVVSKGVDWLGVDSLEEASLIRESGIKTPILVLGYILKENLKKAVENDISVVVYNKETLAELSKLKKPAKIHIKVETGTMRQGVLLEDLEEFIRCAKKSLNIIVEGIYTHFANIEDTTDHSFAKEQLRKFSQALQIAKDLKIKPLAHTACSAALILFPETHFDMVRFGISMYGYWSSPQTLVSSKENKKSILLKPALSWKSVIAQIKNVKSDTPVGYGLMEKTNQDTKIAIVPVGYWDGYDRKLSSVGNVLIGGKRCKIIGRICMNMLMVDINHLPDVKVEDEVVLIGHQGEENIAVEELAQKIGTINYEIISRINPLIPRIYK
ncbi:MAG: alanine racemase [Candidatus Paceibacterota bacterium]|jgi:alanine racemase